MNPALALSQTMWHTITFEQGPYPSWSRDEFQYTTCYLVGSLLGAILAGLIFNGQKLVYFFMPISHDPNATERLRRKSTLELLKKKKRNLKRSASSDDREKKTDNFKNITVEEPSSSNKESEKDKHE